MRRAMRYKQVNKMQFEDFNGARYRRSKVKHLSLTIHNPEMRITRFNISFTKHCQTTFKRYKDVQKRKQVLKKK
jgi:hypothetical protein